MKKYFCFSDAHGYYSILVSALKKAGFDKNNPEHILISCGDEFDRGHEAVKLFNFLKKYHEQGRLILIWGNHTTLLEDCVEELNEYGRPQGRHHYSNGTVGTIAQLVGDKNVTANLDYWNKLSPVQLEKVNKKMQPVIDLLDTAVNYVELGNFIFTHGWIPVEYDTTDGFGYKVVKNWRNLQDNSRFWEEAHWMGYPKAIENECYEEGKIIVCGHWHANKYRNMIGEIKDEFVNKFHPMFPDAYRTVITDKFILLDACTVVSRICNVIVINENEDGTYTLQK